MKVLHVEHFAQRPFRGGIEAAGGERAREAFSRLTRAELENNVQRYLYVHGFQTSWPNQGLTDGDGAIAVLEMRRRSLEFAEREALV